MIEAYPQEIESQMKALYKRLPERSRRLYAAVEALKLPYGGISYIARLFGCSRELIRGGIKELDEEDSLGPERHRREGGGRKSMLEKYPELNALFLGILQEHTAGEPMNEKVKWTNLSRARISELLAEKGFKVSRNIVRQLLKNNGYVKRKPLKKSRPANMPSATLSLKG